MTDKCKSIRKRMLEISAAGRDGNLQSCFSSVEILWTIYDGILDLTPEKLARPHDRFFLSKGQSNLALMTVLAEKGLIPRTELGGFCSFDSRIAMQADKTKFEGQIENSAGSLGHGFPMAVGAAWAAKIKKTGERVFVLAGDGEMNEGTMWEAALFAASEGLDNLTLVVDDNGSIGRMLSFGDLAAKLEAFGFETETVDGHSENELTAALKKTGDRPRAIIAKTVRGYGSKTLTEDRSWFHRYPTESELAELKREVDAF